MIQVIFGYWYKNTTKDTIPVENESQIYQISCKDCITKYIGKTNTNLKIRTKEQFRNLCNFGQVAQAAKLLAMDWMAWDWSQVAMGVEIFLHSTSWLVLGPTQPPVKWVPGLSLGVKAAECRTSHTASSQCCGCVYVDPCFHLPCGPSWPELGIILP